MSTFNNIDPLNYWVQHILPLVYDDSLSYMELLGKVTDKLNSIINNNNNLPSYINTLIKEYISSGEIEKVLSDILANYTLNVKFPPEGLTPAKGDGSSNDTAAIQGCIDYAISHGGLTVFFPSGSYLCDPLNVYGRCSLLGQDRYTTTLVLAGGATKALINGNPETFSISKLGLNANLQAQVNEVDTINLHCGNLIITECFLTGGNIIGNIDVDYTAQFDNIIFNEAAEKSLNIYGTGFVQATNLYFVSLSALSGICFIDIGVSNSIFSGITIAGNSNNAINISGDNNFLKAKIIISNIPFNDNGSGNNIIIINGDVKLHNENVAFDFNSADLTFLNNLALTAANVNETLSGDKTFNSKKFTSETEEFNINSESVAIDGNSFTEKFVNKTIEINENFSLSANNVSETIVGDYTINAGDISVTSDNLTESFTESKNTTAENIHEKANNIVIEGNITEIKGTLKYGTPQKINDYFGGVNLQNENGDTYTVLTKGDKELSLLSEKHIILVGDSYATGFNVGHPDTSNWMDNAIGFINNPKIIFYQCKKGGTAFGDTRPEYTFLQQLKDWESAVPDKTLITDIMVFGGRNDMQFELTAIIDGYREFINYCKTTYPNALVTIGMIGGIIEGNQLETWRKVVEAYSYCSQHGGAFANNLQYSLMDSVYMAPDAIHPSEYGQQMLGKNIANYILNHNVCTSLHLVNSPSYFTTSFTPVDNPLSVEQYRNNGMAFVNNYAPATYSITPQEITCNGVEILIGQFNRLLIIGQDSMDNGYYYPVLMQDSSNIYHNVPCRIYLKNTGLYISPFAVDDNGFLSLTGVSKIYIPPFSITQKF